MRDRLGWGVVVWAVVWAALAPAGAFAQQHQQQVVPPVVAGYHPLKDDAKAGEAAAGELLLSELNCTVCHEPEGEAAVQRVGPKGAPDLSEVGARVTPQWLRAYLASPHGVKPGATMPDVLHAMSRRSGSARVSC